MNERHLDATVRHGYTPVGDSALRADSRLIGRVASGDGRTLISRMTIPIRTGRAWEVPAGSVVRFSILEGPQVLDVNMWGRHDTRERFWAARTRQFYGTHVTTGDRLWSSLPYLRPLATIVADTIAYGYDDDGAGCHDLLGTRCDPYVTEVLNDASYDYHCHSLLARAIRPYGLNEYDVHDVMNLFQVTGLMPDDHSYFMKPSPGWPGDYFEVLAETDLLMAAATCPGGDLSVPLWGPDSGAVPTRNPMGVEVFALDDEVLVGWSSSAASKRRRVLDETPGQFDLTLATTPAPAALVP